MLITGCRRDLCDESTHEYQTEKDSIERPSLRYKPLATCWHRYIKSREHRRLLLHF